MKSHKFKNLFIASVLLFTAVVGTAQAECTLRGYGVRVATFEGMTFLYFRATHTANYYYLGFTTDPFVSDAMYQGYKGKAKLFVRSNASSCPSPISPGKNVIGQITIVGLGY